MRYVSVVYARLFSFTSVGYHILCHYLDTIKVSCSNVDCELIVSWSNILLFFPCTGFAKLNSLAAFVFSSRYSQSFDALHKNFSFYQQTIASLLQVTEGERLTLTLWFTRDSSFDEDPKLLSFLSQTSLSYEPADQNSYIPLTASDNMYWFSYDQSGFDIRCARIHILGFSFRASSDEESKSASAAPADDPIELLGKPLRVGRGDDVFGKIFANSLHALQVSAFCILSFLGGFDSALRLSAIGSYAHILLKQDTLAVRSEYFL